MSDSSHCPSQKDETSVRIVFVVFGLQNDVCGGARLFRIQIGHQQSFLMEILLSPDNNI